MIFDKLKTLDKNIQISIIGHNNPDVDSIFSSLLLVNYLKLLGFKNSNLYIEDDKIEKETLEIIKIILKDFNLENYKNLSENIILIDHTKEYCNKNLIGIIDHHPPFNWINGYIYNRQACSSSCVLMDLIKNDILFEKFLTKENIDMFLVSGIIDCDNFRNPKTVLSDKEMILQYSKTISYFDELVKIADRDTDVSNINYAARHGLKEYYLSDKIIKVSYIMISEESSNLESLLINEIKKSLLNEYLWAIIIINKSSLNSKVIEVYNDKIEYIYFDKLISRGTDYIPMLKLKVKESL